MIPRRNIRFRVWDGETMWGPGDDEFHLHQQGDVHHNFCDTGKVFKYALLSTGLHDADGKEIFEGDILEGIFNKECIVTIVFDSGFEVHEGGANCGSLKLQNCAFRIIGDLFQTPELVSGGE